MYTFSQLLNALSVSKSEAEFYQKVTQTTNSYTELFSKYIKLTFSLNVTNEQ